MGFLVFFFHKEAHHRSLELACGKHGYGRGWREDKIEHQTPRIGARVSEPGETIGEGRLQIKWD